MADQAKYAEKIAKILRQAESVAGTPEADTFVRRAQELMTTWCIDEAMLARARGDVEKVKEDIIEETIEYKGVYHRAQYQIGSTITGSNDCKALITNYGKSSHLHVIGFESDVRNVLMLNTSLQIQCADALNKWWQKQDTGWMSAMDKFKERREFIYGFASGLASQLYTAKTAGRVQAAQNEAQRSEIDLEQATESVALVIRTKEENVKDWIDNRYGRLRPGRATSRSRGGYGASSAGRAAGSTANAGRSSIGGSSRKALT